MTSASCQPGPDQPSDPGPQPRRSILRRSILRRVFLGRSSDRAGRGRRDRVPPVTARATWPWSLPLASDLSVSERPTGN